MNDWAMASETACAFRPVIAKVCPYLSLKIVLFPGIQHTCIVLCVLDVLGGAWKAVLLSLKTQQHSKVIRVLGLCASMDGLLRTTRGF